MLFLKDKHSHFIITIFVIIFTNQFFLFIFISFS